MKTALVITAAGLMSFGIAGITPAAAYHLSPESTSFTGAGKTSATKNGVSLPCKASFTGHVDSSGVGWVDSGTFTGQVGCSTVGLQNLPWKSLAKSAKKVTIFNVTFTSPIGNCGPSKLPVKLVNGVITFNTVPISGGCTVSGKITTTPALSIVP
jgi:hypothetical protein